jgi:pyruvate,water dikinase
MSIDFLPPGPGGWDLDRSHYFGGTTPISQWLMEEGCAAGVRRTFAELGVPADTVEVRFVHGFMYVRLRPLVAPGRAATKVPPAPILKVVSRLHPAFRRRTHQAATTLAERPWRQVCADWTATIRPGLERANLALQDVDVAELDEGGLARHLEDLLAHLRRTFEQHFHLHGYDLGPLGMLLSEGREWGLTAAELVAALEGASPSTSAPAEALGAIRAAVARAGVTPSSLAELRATSPEVNAALDEYLRLRGWVMFSRYDLEGLTLNEAPEVLLATILKPGADTGQSSARAEATAAALRARVPDSHRARFDDLLAEARAAMDLRDDNGPNTVEWPIGLLRRGLLEAGGRLARTGRLADPALMFDLAPDEVAPLVRTGTGPTSDELAERRRLRLAAAAATPPLHLGPVEPPPPLGALPAPLATMVGVVNAVLAELGMDGTRPTGAEGGLSGVGVGQTCYRGTARLAAAPEDALARMEPGDVLVVRATSPAYNLVLSLAGAVVTADGGPLSHAAVLARELGIPAVVGAPHALDAIPDGAHVEVDPVAGCVRVLS